MLFKLRRICVFDFEKGHVENQFATKKKERKEMGDLVSRSTKVLSCKPVNLIVTFPPLGKVFSASSPRRAPALARLSVSSPSKHCELIDRASGWPETNEAS